MCCAITADVANMAIVMNSVFFIVYFFVYQILI